IFWESTKFEGLTDLTEPWYGTAYSVERLPGSKIEQWIETASNEDLHLPGPNVFIPTDLSLKTVSEQMILPVLLRKTPYSRLWFKPDTAFSTPKAYVKIDFNCPVSGNSPESEVLTEIFTRLLMDYLKMIITVCFSPGAVANSQNSCFSDFYFLFLHISAYDAQVAGLYYGVTNTNYGFQVHQDDFRLNVILQLFALIAKQPAFHQLRSVEQLGYITVLMQRYDSGVRGVQFIIQSNVKVVELKRVSQRELIDFFNDYIKVGALQKKSLSVRVYGNTHSSEQQADNSQPAESNNVQIEDIFSFRRSRPLYGSFRGGFGHLKLKDIKSADQGQK
ncbi:UNVERIFIED_CONTAM: Insulin-degrading enzyme-like 1, peroxisomal, partial [Sesamum angustifolium]